MMDPIVDAASVALFRDRDTVLLVRRARAPGFGLWSLPGGRLEKDERPAAAAQRELQEETGLVATGLLALGARVVVREKTRFRLHVFTAPLPDQPVSLNDEVSDWALVPISDLGSRPTTEGLAEVVATARWRLFDRPA